MRFKQKYLESDLKGKTFNKVTILYFTRRDNGGNQKVWCKCECGIEREFGLTTLVTLATKSCGCARLKSQKYLPPGQRKCNLCKIIMSKEDFDIIYKGEPKRGKVTVCKLCNQNTHLIKTHGITLNDKLLLIEKQHHKCAICKKKFIKTSDAKVDHCHVSGKIRGILCGLCNQGLGLFKDSTKNLNQAINYLKQTKL